MAIELNDDVKTENTYDSLKLDDEDLKAIEGDEKDDKDDKKSKKDEKEDDKLELEEEKKEDDEKDEEKEEDEFKDNDLAVPPKRAEILKAYPDIFKKFPFFEGALRREQAFSELLGSVDDAKEVVDKAKDYDAFSEGLLKGDITDVLATIKGNDPKAYESLIDNYLPTLSKIDNSAYQWMIGDVINRAIHSAVIEANRLDKGNDSDKEQSKNLRAAAGIIHKFMFNSSELKAPAKFAKGSAAPEVDAERQKLQEEKAELAFERYEEHLETIDNRVTNILRSTINEHIDARGIMGPYVKKNAVNDALEMLDNMIEEDSRFKSQLDKLWEKAIDAGYDNASIGKIRAIYLGKAKSLLPDVIRKVRQEALKNTADNRGKDDRRMNRDVSDRVERNEESKNSNRDRGSKSQDGRGMKTVDYFLQD